MPVNLPDLANGLHQYNTGVQPGDRRGDSFRVVLEKMNENVAILLTINDAMAGAGTSWDSIARTLSVSLPIGKLAVDGDIYWFNSNQFRVQSDTFEIFDIDGSLITGPLTNVDLGLANENIFIGDATNVAVPKPLNTVEFDLTQTELEIGIIDWDKITNVSLDPEDINKLNAEPLATLALATQLLALVDDSGTPRFQWVDAITGGTY